MPWREIERRRRRWEFAAIMAAGLAATLLLGSVLHLYVEGLLSDQRSRNRFLRDEIGRLDKRLREIRDLEQAKEELLGKMNAIHRLQKSRPEMVHLFDELATGIPAGVHLTRIRQSGRSVVLEGHARSNALISTLMRNIEVSEWIGKPFLILIEHKDEAGTGSSRFRLRFEQLSATKKEAGETKAEI